MFEHWVVLYCTYIHAFSVMDHGIFFSLLFLFECRFYDGSLNIFHGFRWISFAILKIAHIIMGMASLNNSVDRYTVS